MYAIFRALGKQFRAEKGQVLQLPRMAEAPGTTVTFDEVLLTSDGETVKTGTPTVKGAKVVAEVATGRWLVGDIADQLNREPQNRRTSARWFRGSAVQKR